MSTMDFETTVELDTDDMHDKGYNVFGPSSGKEDFFNAAIHNLKVQGVPLEKIISIYVGECKCHSTG